VLQSYGMTETASQVATEPLWHLEQDFQPDRLALLPDWQAEITPDGHLQLAGPALASGWLMPTGDSWAWQPVDGALVTRDRARLWEEGGLRWLSFLGRDSQMLKILGELVHLGSLQGELAKVARELAPSAVVALAARPDTRRGHEIVLRYELGTVQDDELQAIAAGYDARVRPFERLRGMEAATGPLFNEMGKLLAH
jgi:O-succinylbenzoic acid--CoA ligase